MMRLTRWARRIFGTTTSPTEAKEARADRTYATAILLADEVTQKIRERANSINPFRRALGEMLLTQQSRDPYAMADAFEALQEARIFQGAKNGVGG